jgi:hypothetical protein
VDVTQPAAACWFLGTEKPALAAEKLKNFSPRGPLPLTARRAGSIFAPESEMTAYEKGAQDVTLVRTSF